MTYTTEPPLPLLRRNRSTTNPNPNPKPNTTTNNNKLKLVCSFNGAFRPRPPSGKLRYVGGESRIVSVERSVTLAKLRSRISGLYDAPSSFLLKYQLTAPDSSATAETFVTIASDEGVLRMVEKFDKLESYGKSARLWLFVCSSSSYDNDDGDESELSLPKRVGSGLPDTRTRAYAGAAVSNKYGDESLRKMVLLKQQQQQLLAKQSIMKLGRDDNNLVDLNCGNVAQFSVTRSSNNSALNPRDGNLMVVDQVLGPQYLKPPANCASAAVPVCYNGCDANVNRENIVPCDVVRRNGLSCQYGDSLVGKVSPVKVCGGLNSSVRNHRFGVSDSRHQRCYPICVRGHRSNVVAEMGRHRAVRLDGRFVARKCYLGVEPHMIAKQRQAVRVYHRHHPNSWRHCGGISEYAVAERLRMLRGVQYIHQKRCKQKGDAHLQRLNADSEEYRVGYCGAFTNVGEIMSTESLSSSVRTMDIQEDLLTGSGFGKFEGQYQTSYGSVHGVSSTCEPIRCDIDKERGLEDIAKVADISVATENQLPSEETIVCSLKKSENGRNDIRDLYINGVTSSVRNLSLSKEVDGPVVSSDASNIVTLDALLRTQSKLTAPMDEGQLISEPQIKEANGAASTPSFHYSAKLEKDTEQVEEVQQDPASSSRCGEVNNRESLNSSKVIGGSSSDLAAFYTHLATRELQTIRNSDLEFIKELGSGTYGTVYHGKWKGSNVAVKKIKPSCFTDGTLEDRLLADFWKEAHILGQLHHPNIVSFYGVVTDGPVTNLATVTEFMVNGSLKQVLRRKDRTIDRRKRLIIAMDAAFGMEYLHDKSIVHFDLKSHNFLVNMRDPQRPVCKIGDLGLSKIKQRTLVSGGMRGTVPWMAPELLNCHSKNNMVTDKVDVYSFGIVMWELLTGEEPYANLRSEEIIAGIIKGNLRPDIPSWCDPIWRSLMERCWSSDPESRPPFSEIAKELRTMSAAMNIK